VSVTFIYGLIDPRTLEVRYIGKSDSPLSEETKKKISNSCKNRIPWNNGRKGLQIAWNRGKHNE
jgi:hypothetical protein